MWLPPWGFLMLPCEPAVPFPADGACLARREADGCLRCRGSKGGYARGHLGVPIAELRHGLHMGKA